jgi:hypothetical protein
VYRLAGVTKNYQKGRRTVAALRGVDLVIEDGEWLAIQGPTGHGKTTLLQLLGGLDRPTSGTVEFDGHDLGALRESRLTKVRATSIGFVFQTFNLVPTLTAQETSRPPSSRPGPAPPSGGPGPRRHCTRSVSPSGHGTCLPSCPAASSNGSASPAPWSKSPRSCWPMSRRATSTPAPGTTSSPCSTGSGANAASPSSWSPTTATSQAGPSVSAP